MFEQLKPYLDGSTAVDYKELTTAIKKAIAILDTVQSLHPSFIEIKTIYHQYVNSEKANPPQIKDFVYYWMCLLNQEDIDREISGPWWEEPSEHTLPDARLYDIPTLTALINKSIYEMSLHALTHELDYHIDAAKVYLHFNPPPQISLH